MTPLNRLTMELLLLTPDLFTDEHTKTSMLSRLNLHVPLDEDEDATLAQMEFTSKARGLLHSSLTQLKKRNYASIWQEYVAGNEYVLDYTEAAEYLRIKRQVGKKYGSIKNGRILRRYLQDINALCIERLHLDNIKELCCLTLNTSLDYGAILQEIASNLPISTEEKTALLSAPNFERELRHRVWTLLLDGILETLDNNFTKRNTAAIGTKIPANHFAYYRKCLDDIRTTLGGIK